MKIPVPNGGGSGSGSDECTAVAADILEGKTAIFDGSNDEPESGTMKDYSGTTQSATASLDTNNSRVQMTVPNTGKYDNAAKLYNSYSDMRTVIGLTDASKFLAGTKILGLEGTMANVDSIDPAKSQTLSSGVLYVRMTNGAHVTNASSGYPEVSVPQADLANTISLTAAKLGTGQSCLGITGTYKPTVSTIHAFAYCNSQSTDHSSNEASYTATADGTCYYGGLSGSYDAGTNGNIELRIYKNGTLQDSRDIDSTNSYYYRTTMTGQSFSVSAGDVVRVVATVNSYRYMAFAAIIAYIVTYT